MRTNSVTTDGRRPLWRDERVVGDACTPQQDQCAGNDEIPVIGRIRHLDIIWRELQSEAVIYDSKQNEGPPNPPMSIAECALFAVALEVPVLQEAEKRLEENDHRDDDKADDDMVWNGTEKVPKVVGDAYSKSQAANQHYQGEELNRRVNGRDFFPKISVSDDWDAVDGKMNRLFGSISDNTTVGNCD